MDDSFAYELDELVAELKVPDWLLRFTLETFLETYDPLAMYIFGSYAWGRPNPWSDLDIAVIVPEGMADPERYVEGRRKITVYVSPRLEEAGYLVPDLMLTDRPAFERRLSNPATLEHSIYYYGISVYPRKPFKFKEDAPMIAADTSWMERAKNNLIMARKAIDDTDVDLRVECLFHLQQCLEMSFRGFLAFHLQRETTDKMHSIDYLIYRCSLLDDRFAEHVQEGDHYTRYYTLRYKPEAPVPSREATLAEFPFVEKMYATVSRLLETSTRPPTPTFLPDSDEDRWGVFSEAKRFKPKDMKSRERPD